MLTRPLDKICALWAISRGNVLSYNKKHDEAIEAYTKAIALDGTSATSYHNRSLAYSSKGDHLSAIKDAESAIALCPEEPSDYHRLGSALSDEGDFDKAIEAYTKAIALGGSHPHPHCYIGRAMAFSEKGDHLSAIKDVESALAINPDSATVYNGLGWVLLGQKKYDEAIEAYTKAIALDRAEPGYRCHRALAYSYKDDHLSAIKDARRALAIDPKHASAYHRLGWTMFKQGKNDIAIKAYTKAIELDSTNPNFYCGRAEVHLREGNHLSAIRDAESALAINPKHDIGYYRLGLALFKEGKYDEAIEAYSKAIAHRGTEADFYSDRARAHSSKGDYHSTFKDAQTALAINPKHGPSYYQLGRALFGQEKYDEAIEAYNNAIELTLDNTEPEYYSERARAYSSKGDHLSAARAAKSAVTVNPRFDAGYYQLGQALFNQEKYDEAIQAYTTAINFNRGRDYMYYSERARAYSSKGDHLLARDDASSVVVRNPKFAIGFCQLGHAYDSLGDAKAAENALERGLKLDPTHPGLNSLLATVKAKLSPDGGTSIQPTQDKQDSSIRINESNKSQILPHDLHVLENRLLRSLRTVEPRAIECIPGTRTQILADVAAWADNRDSPNMLWIRGAPGSGKSSISLSAKSRLRDQGRLVTYFRFDRNEATITNSVTLWRQVAYDLTRLLPTMRTKLLQTFQDDRMDLNSSIAVFTSLIEKPLSNLTDPRSLVIVIDALDECGGLTGRSSLDRRMLLRALGRWHRLPKCFKLLVTSREESDINRVLALISVPINILSGHHLTENPHASASIHAVNDIRMFLEDRFLCVREWIPSLPPGWPGSTTIVDMVLHAAGNFLWATTAANFIDCRGIDPHNRLGRIMGPMPDSICMRPLYSLYNTILDTAFGDIADDGLELKALQTILGTMVLTRRPLHDIEYITVLTSRSVTEAMLDSIRTGLRSVIATGAGLRFAHKSFDDFLLSEECSEKYRIRVEESQYLLARFCITTMAEGLRFNMCRLESSYLKNAEVPDIETKAREGIPALLAYSCCFWADHLSLTPFEETLMAEIRDMILDKLLYWLEAMSLLKEFNRVSYCLLSLLKWSHSSPNDEFRDFLHDARRFVGAFGQPIVQSAPHIYTSAFAFAPEYSSVARHFLPRLPCILELSRGRSTDWPSCVFTSEYHKDKVCSISFSSDEKYFVSGSTDGTMCICDADTGNLISGPFGLGGPGSSVDYVCFDSDTRRVWAAMGQVASWDVETGEECIGFGVEGATGCCCLNGGRNIISVSRREGSVAFWNGDTGTRLRNIPMGNMVHMVAFSPDGCHMACAREYDTIVRIWTVVDGSNLQGPVRSRRQIKHQSRISALTFSVDGKFAVSGSIDGTILIWDAKTGDTVGRPLATGTEVNSAAFCSPKNILVTASGDPGTVMVWNTSTYEVVLGPLEGHTSWIRAITLSRDCRRALTASWDGTVRMWDLSRSGVRLAANAYEGHSATIQCVAFSPCGKKLTSLDQWTIRVWDANTGNPLLGPINNESFFSRITFSPSGSKIVAYCSGDGHIQVINADTGELGILEDLSDAGWEQTCIEQVSFRSTDLHLITCSDHGIVRIWRLEDDAMTQDPPPSSLQGANVGKHKLLAFSTDGSTAIAHDVERHYVWSTTTYQPLPITFADDEYISGDRVVYSPSGLFFVVTSCGSQDTFRIWNTHTGKLAAGPSTLHGRIDCLAFSPNDRHIAFCSSFHSTSESTTEIWDIHTGRPVSRPKKHTGNITALDFSPDGEKLVSASDDFQLRIWKMSDLLGESQVMLDGPLGAEPSIQDGWVMDARGNLLFWVPKDHRTGLMLPGNATVISGSRIRTELDFSRFRCGKNWTECFEEDDQAIRTAYGFSA